MTENLKLQLSPGLVASYDIQPGNGVGLFWDKHTRVQTNEDTIVRFQYQVGKSF